MNIADTLKTILPSEAEVYNTINTEKGISYYSIKFSYNKINIVIDIADCGANWYADKINKYIIGVKEFKIEKYNSNYRHTVYFSLSSEGLLEQAVVVNDTFIGVPTCYIETSLFLTIEEYLKNINEEIIDIVTYYSTTPNFTVINKVYQNMNSVPKFDIDKFHKKEVFIDVDEFNNTMKGLLSGTGYNVVLNVEKFRTNTYLGTTIVKGNKALQIDNDMISFFLLCTESQLVYYIDNMINRAEEKMLDVNAVPEGCVVLSYEEEDSTVVNITDVEYRSNLGATVIDIGRCGEILEVKKDNINNLLMSDIKSFINNIKIKCTKSSTGTGDVYRIGVNYMENRVKIQDKNYYAYSDKGVLKLIISDGKVVNDRRMFRSVKSTLFEKERNTTEYNTKTNSENFPGEYYPVEDVE